MDGGADQYRRFLMGDKNGMTEIIKDCKDGLIFYLNGIVGDPQTAEDLAEDTVESGETDLQVEAFGGTFVGDIKGNLY